MAGVLCSLPGHVYLTASSPPALTTEQSAIWSYPHREGDEEEFVFNMNKRPMLLVAAYTSQNSELFRSHPLRLSEALYEVRAV